MHIFERAGLGCAPFRVTGYDRLNYHACPGAPIQPGGSCDYCGTGIHDAFYIRSADGQTFKVGSTCVYQTGDKGLIDPVKRTMNRVKREATQRRNHVRIETARALLHHSDAVHAALARQPHPMGFKDRVSGEPLTLADWCEWMFTHAGTSGQLRAVKVINNIQKRETVS